MESTTDNNNSIAPSHVDLNIGGAEGIDRNTIIKEVENG